MKKRWSDSVFWQWTLHGLIGFGWAFAGASIIWLGASVYVAYLVGFWSAFVSVTMKEATDQTVYEALKGLGDDHGHLHVGGKKIHEHLDWHGWDWLDFAQHIVGGFIGAWVPIAIWYL